MNVATVFESSEPDSIILRQSGIISVVSKKLITSCSSVFTSAPEKKTYFVKTYFCSSLKKSLLCDKKRLIETQDKRIISVKWYCSIISNRNSFNWSHNDLPITPKLVNRRYSKGLVLLTVCKNG